MHDPCQVLHSSMINDDTCHVCLRAGTHKKKTETVWNMLLCANSAASKASAKSSTIVLIVSRSGVLGVLQASWARSTHPLAVWLGHDVPTRYSFQVPSVSEQRFSASVSSRYLPFCALSKTWKVSKRIKTAKCKQSARIHQAVKKAKYGEVL